MRLVKKLFDKKVRTKSRRRETIFGGRCVFYQEQAVSQENFPLIFRDGMLCMLCSTTTQTTYGIQQRLLVLEILEIAIAVLTPLS